MSVPLPSSNLEGHCSAINNGTLYVLSPGAFQSLPLSQKAQWSTERMGESVTGPACVTAASGDDESTAALYVIGGQSGNDSFTGFQRYTFGTQSWETLSPLDSNLQQRTNHGAVYLSDSQSILVYAGSQYTQSAGLSSQTFLISTQSPYNIQSFISHAPPGNQPILQPWNSSHAVMVGGTDTNAEVWTFGPNEGWQQLATNLTAPLETSTRALLLSLDDGAKVLEIYNMSATPNTVTDVVLLDSNGTTAADGQTAGGRSSSSRKRKRNLNLGDWPSYNGTWAPTVARPDCSIAQTPEGMVVIAGGSNTVPVAIFDQAQNSWVNAGHFFDDSGQKPLMPSSTPSATSPTGTPTSTPAASSSGQSDTHKHTMTVLGITLGVLFGIAAIFAIILLFLRWRKAEQRRSQEQREKDGGNRLSFADRGASFMKEAEGSMLNFPRPPQSRLDSHRGSNSSLAIIAKFGTKLGSDVGAGGKSSFDSTTRLVRDKSGTVSPAEPLEMANIGDRTQPKNSLLVVPGDAARGLPLDREARAERKRSSGWSKYFATSQPAGADGLAHIPSGYIKPGDPFGTPVDANGMTAQQSYMPPAKRVPPPLDLPPNPNIDGQRLSQVASGSPTISHSRDDLALRGSGAHIDGQRGQLDYHNAGRKSSNSVSSYGNRSTVSSNVASEILNEPGLMPWTPTNSHFKDMISSRHASSNYTDSVDMSNRVPSRGKSPGFFPGAGTSYRPKSRGKDKYNLAAPLDWSAISDPKVLSIQHPQDRDSNITVFPSGVSEADIPKRDSETTASHPVPQGRQPPIHSDMSWLDLDLDKNRNANGR